MKSTIILGALSLVFACTSVSFAQVPPPRPLPSRELLMKLQRDRIEQMERQLERIMKAMEQDLEFGALPFDPLQMPFEPFLQPNRFGGQPFGGQPNGNTFFGAGMAWGGMKLDKVSKDMQENLGLPEKEGLIVNGVEANSAAEKAGVKINDILVRVGKTAVPNDFDAFSKVVKDQKPDADIDLVVVRDGAEKSLKATKMPATVQLGVGNESFVPGFGKKGRPGFGGPGGFPGRGAIMPRIEINRGNGGVINMSTTLNINGAKIVRSQNGDDFSGEYSKDDLNVRVRGKFERGLAKPSEINVQDGKDAKKYTDLKDVPPQYQPMLRQIMPNTAIGLLPIPLFPNFPEFPALPNFPDFE